MQTTHYTTTERIYVDAAGNRVGRSDPRAARVFASAGKRIAIEDALRLGLLDGPAVADDDGTEIAGVIEGGEFVATEPQEAAGVAAPGPVDDDATADAKALTAPEDKAQRAPGNKSRERTRSRGR